VRVIMMGETHVTARARADRVLRLNGQQATGAISFQAKTGTRTGCRFILDGPHQHHIKQLESPPHCFHSRFPPFGILHCFYSSTLLVSLLFHCSLTMIQEIIVCTVSPATHHCRLVLQCVFSQLLCCAFSLRRSLIAQKTFENVYLKRRTRLFILTSFRSYDSPQANPFIPATMPFLQIPP
jgi:hypothetical protein